MKTAYEPCYNCNGQGHETSPINGEIVTCTECQGNNVVRYRNERGQYATREIKQNEISS